MGTGFWQPTAEELQDYEFWPWWRGVRKTDFAQVAGTAITASRQLQPTGVCKQLMGWAVAETTGTATASFRLRDGTTASDAIFARVNLAANESTRERWGPPGVICVSGGIYLDFIAGSFEGVIYWI